MPELERTRLDRWLWYARFFKTRALARQAVFGMAKGWGLSMAARLVIGFLMMVLWWIWVWKG